MRSGTLHEPGYLESFAIHVAGYLQQSAASLSEVTWVRKFQNRISGTEIVKKTEDAVKKNTQEVVGYSKGLASAIAPFGHDLIYNENAPTVASDFKHVFRKTVAPAFITLASTSLLLSAVKPNFSAISFSDFSFESTTNIFLVGLWLASLAVTVVAYVDFVIPSALLFIVQTSVLGVDYRQKFDELTKNKRIVDAQCCDDKCTALRKVKGEVRDVVGYITQSLYLLMMQVMMEGISFALADTMYGQSIDFIMRTSLFLVNILHLGQAALVMRYASDGVCQRERLESVNNNIKFVMMLGLLQAAGTSGLQKLIWPLEYVPGIMMASATSLTLLGLVHYIEKVPQPRRLTIQSSAYKFLPTNSVYPIVGDIIDRIIDSFKQRCIDPLETDNGREWQSWHVFQQDITSFLKNLYETKLSVWDKSAINLVVRYGKYVLPPELSQLDNFLADPIFKKYWPNIFLQITEIIDAILMYRLVITSTASVVKVINQLGETINSIPGLRTGISFLSQIFLGVNDKFFSPDFVLKLSEDGLSSLVDVVDYVCKYLEVSEERKVILQDAKVNIQKFKAFRQLSFRVLEAIKPHLGLIIRHLKNERFVDDIMMLSYQLRAKMIAHKVGPYAYLIDRTTGIELIDLSMMLRITLLELYNNKESAKLIYSSFDKADSIITQENNAYKAKILRFFEEINEMAFDEEIKEMASDTRQSMKSSENGVVEFGSYVADLRDEYGQHPLAQYLNSLLNRYVEIQYKEYANRKNIKARYIKEISVALSGDIEKSLRSEAYTTLDEDYEKFVDEFQAVALHNILPGIRMLVEEYFTLRVKLISEECLERKSIVSKDCNELLNGDPFNVAAKDKEIKEFDTLLYDYMSAFYQSMEGVNFRNSKLNPFDKGVAFRREYFSSLRNLIHGQVVQKNLIANVKLNFYQNCALSNQLMQYQFQQQFQQKFLIFTQLKFEMIENSLESFAIESFAIDSFDELYVMMTQFDDTRSLLINNLYEVIVSMYEKVLLYRETALKLFKQQVLQICIGMPALVEWQVLCDVNKTYERLQYENSAYIEKISDFFEVTVDVGAESGPPSAKKVIASLLDELIAYLKQTSEIIDMEKLDQEQVLQQLQNSMLNSGDVVFETALENAFEQLSSTEVESLYQELKKYVETAVEESKEGLNKIKDKKVVSQAVQTEVVKELATTTHQQKSRQKKIAAIDACRGRELDQHFLKRDKIYRQEFFARQKIVAAFTKELFTKKAASVPAPLPLTLQPGRLFSQPVMVQQSAAQWSTRVMVSDSPVTSDFDLAEDDPDLYAESKPSKGMIKSESFDVVRGEEMQAKASNTTKTFEPTSYFNTGGGFY